jgi:hypothetical protein
MAAVFVSMFHTGPASGVSHYPVAPYQRLSVARPHARCDLALLDPHRLQIDGCRLDARVSEPALDKIRCARSIVALARQHHAKGWSGTGNGATVLHPNYAQAGTLYTPEGRRKYITGDERRRFLAAALACQRRELATLCLTLAHTGRQISEALSIAPSTKTPFIS